MTTLSLRSCIRGMGFLCMLLIGSSVFGQLGGVNTSSISGFVFDPNRQPVGQIYVELKSEFSTVARVRTDGSGRFTFRGLAHGRYTIRVLPLGTGMEEQYEDVEIAGIGARGRALPEHVQKDVYLRARKNSANSPFQNEVVYAQEVPKEAEALYKDAVNDLGTQRVQEGVQSLEKAIGIFPDYFMAIQKLAQVRLAEDKFDEAIELFKRALKINQRCFDCMFGVAHASYSVRKYPEAVAAAEDAIKEKPGSFEAYLVLGMGYRMTKEFAKAEKALLQANKNADGQSPDVHWQLALLYGKELEKFDDAAKSLESFLKVSPEAPNKEDVKKLIKQFKDKAKAKA